MEKSARQTVAPGLEIGRASGCKVVWSLVRLLSLTMACELPGRKRSESMRLLL